MRLILISDTHTMHKSLNNQLKNLIDINQHNVLIHAGDISGIGNKGEVTEFIYWIQNLKGFDTKIFIAGNHDLSFETKHKPKPDWLQHLLYEENLNQSDCVYLEDNDLIVELPEFTRPIKFYGSPWQPEFMNWGFNLPRNGKDIEQKWSMIPEDTDILITHCPPFGIYDSVRYGQPLGCKKLLQRVNKLNLILNVFGHIHDGHGAKYINNTLYVNAAICTEEYYPINNPFVVDLIEINGKVTTKIIV